MYFILMTVGKNLDLTRTYYEFFPLKMNSEKLAEELVQMFGLELNLKVIE